MTPDSTETSDEDASSLVRPSSDEVLRELEVLRHGPGLSPQRIRERGPRIQELIVVHDQLDLEHLHPEDTHLAAYSAIGCVIEHTIRDYQHQQILILTMRYDPLLLSVRGDTQAWDNVLQAPTVSQRDALVQALLFYSKSVYFVKRQNAYFELANQLAMRTTTPCRNGKPSKAEIETSLLTTRQILGYLALEGEHLLREFLAGEVLQRIKSEWQSQAGDPPRTAMEQLWHVLERAISDVYPRYSLDIAWAYQGDDPREHHPDEHCLNGETLLLLLKPRGFKEFWSTLLAEGARGEASTHDERLEAIQKLDTSLGLLAYIIAHPDDRYDESEDILKSLGIRRILDSDVHDVSKDERRT